MFTARLEHKKALDYDTDKAGSTENCSVLIQLYSLATFLQMEKLANGAVDMHLDHCQRWADSSWVCEYLEEEHIVNSKLMHIYLAKCVSRLRRKGVGSEANPTHLDEYAYKESARMHRLVTAMLAPKVDFCKIRNACKWHTYNTTEVCKSGR
jgi:hypothetical protein